MNESKRYCSRGRNEGALNRAVRLVFRQLSDGIGIDEAVQMAARFHNVTCAAIEAELVGKNLSTEQTWTEKVIKLRKAG